jgi:pyruvate formate lyase activating enzyme
LRRARQIAQQKGLHYVFVGNVHDPEADSTRCHACGALLIGRDWYELTAWKLHNDNQCPRCGTVCAGVFEAEPGDWGRRRLPVELQSLRGRSG